MAVTTPQQPTIAAPKISGLLRLLYRLKLGNVQRRAGFQLIGQR